MLQTTKRKIAVDYFVGGTKGCDLVELCRICMQHTAIWLRTQCPGQHSHLLEYHYIFPRGCMFNLLAVWCVLPPPCPDNQRGSGASIRFLGTLGTDGFRAAKGCLERWPRCLGTMQISLSVNHFIINAGQPRAHWALPPTVAALQELLLSRDNSQGYSQGWKVPWHNGSSGSHQ